MAHAHERGTAATQSRARLTATFAITAMFMLLEAAGGVWSGSLALLADAAHMLADAGGLALSLFAIWIATRPPTPEKTYGYYRVEILAALVNAIVLLVVAGAILVEAWDRIREPHDVLATPMLVVAAIGLAVNLIGVRLLHHGADASLNVRAAYLEVMSDALSSGGVLVAAAIVLATGFTFADPAMSIVISLMIIWRTWHLLRQAVNVLLEGTPAHLSLVEIEGALRAVAGVQRVHELHVWTLTSGREALSAHVVVDDVREIDRLLEELHAVAHARFGIDHTTIQVESAPPLVLQIKPPAVS